MIEIPQELVERVLAIYKPEQRLLKKASFKYPVVKGQFLIGPTYYALERLKHATDIEIQLCLNQLGYAGVAEEIRQGLNPHLADIDFFELQKEGIFIIESRKRFRRHIPSDKPIYGEIKYIKEKKIGSLLIRFANFQFEDSACNGSLELALTLP